MKRWMTVLMLACASAAVPTEGKAAEPVFHFFTSLGVQGEMECWVSGERFRTERSVEGVKMVYVCDGDRFFEFRQGGNVATPMPMNQIPSLATWRSEYQPRMGTLTKGAPQKIGAVECTPQTYTVKSRRGEIAVTEYIEPMSGLMVKREVTLGDTHQTSEVKRLEVLATVPEGWFGLPAGVKVPVPPVPGMKAEAFTLKRHDTGAAVALGELLGKNAVVLNFFATWCPPCHAETPDFVKLYAEYRSQGVEFVSVDTGERPGTDPKVVVPEFVKKYGVAWPVLLDETGFPVTALYRVEGLPTNLVINKEGVITYIKAGGMSEAVLRKELDKALGKAKSVNSNPFNDPD